MEETLRRVRSTTRLEARDLDLSGIAPGGHNATVNSTATIVPLEPVSFDVYWHVIYANETKEGGYVSDSQIMEQMKVINDDFKSANISWNFKNITRVENEDWFVNVWPGSPQEQEMKAKYHKGDSTVLNIFTAQFNATTKTLGFASLPSSYLRAPLSDGLLIKHTTLPAGSHPNYNHGRTMTHELGHWLGLYHTFEGGCEGVGDNVDDTPPEASEAVGCPVGRRSCPGSEMDDPIHNFMDYSWDTCMTHFTPGQAVRMHEVIWAYRTKRPPVDNSTTAATPPAATSTTISTTISDSAASSSSTRSTPIPVESGDAGSSEEDDSEDAEGEEKEHAGDEDEDEEQDEPRWYYDDSDYPYY
ncbi:metalloprotease [Coprinopsis cinerea okayama7|uniref:Metalloprotease n=1 Tax=Coprinopsis cinerea (strain Okayama-7 / 130 / ATCC MYA-4618 / FGSC 9003) TaxID=240176 RepID=D6RP06_COPC7|nr:metalloprotease [Coprinopsis cinerea okayama7\|eukprot:XP_002910612.1 metalloprotease [Coprinopsis cinerea okayama7\